MGHKGRLVLAAVLGLFPLFPLAAHANAALPADRQAPALIISEVGWAGSSKSASDEWFELTNVSGDPVALAGWTVEGALTAGSVLSLPNAMLAPQSAFLVSNDALGDPGTVLARAPDLVTPTVSLSNGNLGITLKDAGGTVVDQAGNGKTPFAGGTNPPTSMVRAFPLTDGSTKAAWTNATQARGFTDGSPDLGTPGFIEASFVLPTTVPTAALPPTTDAAIQPPTAAPDPAPPTIETVPATENADTEAATVNVVTITAPTEAATDMSTDAGAPAAAASDPPPSDVAASTPVPEAPSADDSLPPPTAAGQPQEVAPTITDTAGGQPQEVAPTITDTVAAAPMLYPPGTLALNELLPAPPKDGQEWAEVHNPFNNVIPLGGWTLKNARGASISLPGELLGFDQYAVVALPSGFLPNGAGKILLLDPNGTMIDWMAYGTGDIPAPRQGEALALDANSAWSITTMPTPGAANAIVPRSLPPPAIPLAPSAPNETSAATDTTGTPEIPQPISAPKPEPTAPLADFALSELYPNTGDDLQDEFVEVKNVGDALADLKGWMLRDHTRTMFVQRTSLVLAPGEAIALPRPMTHLSLANAGGFVDLIRPDQTLADQAAYGATKRGQSFALVDGAWLWTTPTPDEANVPPPVTAVTAPVSPSQTAVAAKKLPKAVHALAHAAASQPASVAGIITGRSGMRIKIEADGRAQTVVLPAGSDAGALGIRSGRTLEARGLLTTKGGATLLTVSSTDDVRTRDPLPPPPSPAQVLAPAEQTLGTKITGLFSAAGLALRQIFGHT